IPRSALKDLPTYVRLEVRDPSGATAGALARISDVIDTPDLPDVGNPNGSPDAGGLPDTIVRKQESDSCFCNSVAQPYPFPVYSLLAFVMLIVFRRIPRSNFRK